ncbi:MAG: hypothetical protein GY742_03295 [Hyphomicrobiales bacterium]|nr:hypothetical protein [Hyphomicrobiales bacterium]
MPMTTGCPFANSAFTWSNWRVFTTSHSLILNLVACDLIFDPGRLQRDSL